MRWFKLLKHRKAINAFIEMKLRLATLEREISGRGYATSNHWERTQGEPSAIAFCAEVSSYFGDDEVPRLSDLESRSFDYDGVDFDFEENDEKQSEANLMAYAFVLFLMTRENKRRFETFFEIDCHKVYRQICNKLHAPVFEDFMLVDEGSVGQFIKRLAAYREEDIPQCDLYTYYLIAFTSEDYVDALDRLMAGKAESITKTLGSTLANLMPDVIFDPIINDLADLAYENGKDSELCQPLWTMTGIDFETDFDEFVPHVKERLEAGCRGTFARLFMEAARENDGSVFINVDDYEFDKGFCSLLAMSIHDWQSLPEALQIEYCRMCHYVGIEVDTELYDFSQPCDYETHEYISEEQPSELDLPLMDSIEIEPGYRIEYEVNWIGGEDFISAQPEDSIWADRCRTFENIRDAIAYAKTMERDRRQWVMDRYPDDRLRQKEVLQQLPVVEVCPLELPEA